jgi:hypothetical protein
MDDTHPQIAMEIQSNIAACALNTTNDALMIYSHAPGDGLSKIYFFGKEYAFAGDAFTAVPLALVHAAIGCQLYPGTYTQLRYFAGLMRFLSVHSGALGANDYALACRGLLGGRMNRILCDGSSLTSGGSGGGGYYVPVLQGKLGALACGKNWVSSIAVAGQSTTDMIARLPTYITPEYASGQNNILVAWEVTSDMFGHGKTARQAVDTFWTYCDTARDIGFSVIVCTCTPRVGYSSAPELAQLDAANALMMAEWESHGYSEIVPLHLNPALMAYANTTYMVDGTHYTQVGCDVIAGMVARAVQRTIAKLG